MTEVPTPAAAPASESNPSYRWDIPSDQVDVDSIAALVVSIRMDEHAPGSRLSVRSWFFAIGFIAALLAVATSSSAAPFAIAGLVVWVGTVAWLGPRASAHRFARRIRSIPALSEGSVFVASPEGTVDTLPSGSSIASWRRWRRALERDGYLVLVNDQNALRFLPWACLTSPAPTDNVVTTVQAWIAAARDLDSNATENAR